MKPNPDSHALSFACLDSFQPEAMDAVLRGTRLDHIQLNRGRLHADLMQANLGGSEFDWGSYNLPLLAKGPMPEDRVTLGFLSGAGDEGLINGVRLRKPIPVIFSETSELDYRLAPLTQWFAFQVARSELEKTGVHVSADFTHLDTLSGQQTRQMHTTLSDTIRLLREINACPLLTPDWGSLITSIRENLLSAFSVVLGVDSLSNSLSRSASESRQRLARRAAEFLDASFSKPIRITEMCDITGTSMKSLERAFQSTYGVTPKQFLTNLRLAKARRKLASRPQTRVSVSQIATQCGFFHLGRFSSAYRSMFDESPSDTLRESVAQSWPNAGGSKPGGALSQG